MENGKMFKIISAILLLVISYNSRCQNFDKLAKDYDSLTSHTIYGNNKKAGQYYSIRGFKMYCEVYGTGEPLLMIHGNGANMSAFVKQIPYFSKKYKVILADSRAHGKSEDNLNDSLTYEMMSDDYNELLNKMGIDSANILGWSDGGIIGLLLAIHHPNKVKKLASTGANLQPDTCAIQPDIASRVRRTYTMFQNKKDMSQLDKTVFKFFKLLVDQPHIQDSDLNKIKIPTLIIGGDHDVQKVSHIIEIYQNIPLAYLWILPNSGHSTLVTHDDDFNKIVDNFFSTPYRIIKDRSRYF